MNLFPIMAEYGGRVSVKVTDYIPYEVVEPHEKQAMKNHGQTLERLAERGGLSYEELIAVLEDREASAIGQRIAKQQTLNCILNYKTKEGC